MFYAIFGALAAGLLGLDQLVKAWTVKTFAAPVPPAIYSTADPAQEFLPGIVELTRIHNYGAAWSSFSGMRWLLLAVTSLIVLVVLFVVVRGIVRPPLGLFSAFLVISGGLGNIIDRARLGYVVDFIDCRFIDFYVFNVADSFVTVGCILFVLVIGWNELKTMREKKAAASAENSGETHE